MKKILGIVVVVALIGIGYQIPVVRGGRGIRAKAR